MANIEAKHGYGQFDTNIFIQEYLGSSKEIYERWKLDTRNKLSNPKHGEKFLIPLKTHVIWLESDTNPIGLKELYIKKYISTCNQLLTADKNFKFYLWTNNPNIALPEGIKNIPNLEIKSIYELKDNILWLELNNSLKRSQVDPTFFVQASDIARVMILVQDGGIYHDFDYEILNAKALCQYMKSYHYINGKEHDFWDATIGNAFTATVANHPISKMEEKLIKRNLDETAKLPLYLEYPYRGFDEVISKTGPVKTTVAVYKVMFSSETYIDDEGNQVTYNNIIMPCFSIYNMALMRDRENTIPSTKTSSLSTKQWEGIELPIIGGDMFSGNWANSSKYQSIIDYSNNEQYHLDHNLTNDNSQSYSINSITGKINLVEAYNKVFFHANNTTSLNQLNDNSQTYSSNSLTHAMTIAEALEHLENLVGTKFANTPDIVGTKLESGAILAELKLQDAAASSAESSISSPTLFSAMLTLCGVVIGAFALID